MDLQGVDVDWVRERADEFLEQTQPIKTEAVPGRARAISLQKPQCGRNKAIALLEPIRKILDKLYPAWQEENKVNPRGEFQQARDATKRLLARLDSYELVSEKLGGLDDAPRFSVGLLHPQVWGAAQPLWVTGHRHEAVGAAAKAVNAYLQSKVNRRDLSEAKLVQEAFSDNPPVSGKARLRFDRYPPETRESMLSGVRGFGAGCFQAIRNPIFHLPNEDIEISEQSALERLAALSLLVRWIDEATIKALD